MVEVAATPIALEKDPNIKFGIVLACGGSDAKRHNITLSCVSVKQKLAKRAVLRKSKIFAHEEFGLPAADTRISATYEGGSGTDGTFSSFPLCN